MKVTKTKVDLFEPFTIEIETREEANVLWHIFNNNGDLRKYWKEKYDRIERIKISGLAVKMWKEIDKVYSPQNRF